MPTALYPGSFDPVTLGHLDVAVRAAALFDKVIVAVYARPAKDLAFNDDERVEMFAKAVSHLPNVEVTKFDGLVVRMAQKVGATVIVRGLRSGADFEYEYDMAFMNRKLAPEIDMVSFMTSQEYMFISSSLLKEVARLGGDIASMVPPHVAEKVRAKFGEPVLEAQRPGKGDIIDIINVIDRLETLIDTSKAVPVSGNVLIDKKKVMELLDQLRLAIPQEIMAAEEVLTEKDHILNQAMLEARRTKAQAEDEYRERLDHNEITLVAENRAGDVVRQAEERAERLGRQSEAQARSRRSEADAYALQSLRTLERELSAITGSVRKGIDLLAADQAAASVDNLAALEGSLPA